MKFTTLQKNALIKKGIDNSSKLKRWYPLYYIDNTTETGVSEALDEKHVVVIGTLDKCEKKSYASKVGDYIQCALTDRKSGITITINFFGNVKYYSMLWNCIGKTMIVCGTLDCNKKYGISISNPTTISEHISKSMRLVPVYSKIKGISAETVESLVSESLAEPEEDTISEADLITYELPGINTSLKNTMRPENQSVISRAAKRIIFDDMYYFAALFELQKREFDVVEGPRIKFCNMTDEIAESLPYSLTNGQIEAISSIKNRMLSGEHLRALIQGDVGCGKTIIAMLLSSLVIENGYQACIIAPRVSLALQHFNDAQKLFAGKGVTVIFDGGNGKITHEDVDSISSGKASLIIGTHALLSDSVKFSNLGLIVIDEEHEFGVVQRETILSKGAHADSISMSATPIPRSLAKALYGDSVSIYEIKDKPAERKPIITYYDNGNKVTSFAEKVLATGHQVYAVCPMIDDSDNETTKGVISVKSAFNIYNKRLGSKYRIAMISGSTSKKESEQILRDFKAGSIQMLVATTVIEVGINVPNATLIIIHNAERFGLSQLHQLRGRVGRGSAQSYCVLQSEDSPAVNSRLLTICKTNDGFKIAKEDLEHIRKSGDLFGTEQSGSNKYMIEMLLNQALYADAKEAVSNADVDTLKRHIQKMEYCQNDVKPKVINIVPDFR